MHKPSMFPCLKCTFSFECESSYCVQFQAPSNRAYSAQVRDVPLGAFTSKYGGDVNTMLVDNINQRLQAAKVTRFCFHSTLSPS